MVIMITTTMSIFKNISFRQNLFTLILLTVSCVYSLKAQDADGELTIEIEQKGSEGKQAAWVRIQTPADDNFGGWYQRRDLKGFPAFSPIKINVPAGLATITAWNSDCDEVSTQILIAEDKLTNCKITLIPRFDLHKSGYFSFDGHNHLDGENVRNCPPYIYPYCAALGIDHLDVCQMWFHEDDKPVSYDSILTYLKEKSTPELSMNFACESPKLRYGHTWYINHPGLKNPFGDYLKWHDVDYYDFVNSTQAEKSDLTDLRGDLHPKWNPPFVDRLRNKARGAFTVAAHPTRWWHGGLNEIYPATNTSADLAFDLLAAQSYDGIVVMGDCKDNLFYQNLWFNTLNLGYRLVPVAETDGNVAGGSLGKLAMTYVWTGEKDFDSKSLVDNLRVGHTMLSGKAIMLLTVDRKLPPGSVLLADGGKHTIDVKVYSEPAADEYVSFLVLYRNGKVVEKLDFREQKKRFVMHQFVVNDTETAWYVVKSYGKVFPKNDLQFDVMAYAEKCLQNSDNDYAKNTGVSMTAPVFFNAVGWQSPKPVISHIHGKVLDNSGQPLNKTLVEIWNIDKKLTELITDDQGNFEIEAPATIDVRFTMPNGQKEQQWLFYEYPPLLDLIEDTYTISWAKTYPGIRGGQMPWEAFHFYEIRDILETIHWTIIPNGKKMLSE
ncbi:MAG TPA: hypothetical protein VMV77_10270 [Bacteroidales bacterium]|nr:hypothetical protein [Bacteroidales bacterium]